MSSSQQHAEFETSLIQRWAQLAAELELSGDILGTGRQLLARYKQPHRHYHNLSHLQYCLDLLEEFRDQFKDAPAAEAAVWFHDAVYDIGSYDNEINSANLARGVLSSLGMTPPSRVERITSMILATSHAEKAKTDDAKLVCDIDLSILGREEQVYRKYAAGIRAEANLDEKTFAAKRIQFLESMLWLFQPMFGRRGLFHTELFKSRYGAQAYKNMHREIIELRGSAPAEFDAAMAEVRQRVEDLYETFSPHRIGREIATDSGPITSGPLMGPLADVIPGDICRYAEKAMTTQGSVGDFKHFLPRLFELLVAEGTLSFEVEILVGKLEYGHWREWPDQERKAVLGFLHAWWRAVLAEFPENIDTLQEWQYAGDLNSGSRLYISASNCLCSIAQACADIQPFLDEWLTWKPVAALRHLAAFVDVNWEQLRKNGELDNCFWNSCVRVGETDSASLVIRWLVREEIVSHLRAGSRAMADTTMALELDKAADRVEKLVSEWEDKITQPPRGETEK